MPGFVNRMKILILGIAQMVGISKKPTLYVVPVPSQKSLKILFSNASTLPLDAIFTCYRTHHASLLIWKEENRSCCGVLQVISGNNSGLKLVFWSISCSQFLTLFIPLPCPQILHVNFNLQQYIDAIRRPGSTWVCAGQWGSERWYHY